MHHYPKTIFIYGFALFGMFFGSGNLVFPIQIGNITAQYWFMGFLGLFLTGIILPFLGLFVVKLHHGSYQEFFGEAGYLTKIILPFFTLSLLGPFGVVPRCITVAHGGINYLAPIPLQIFSIIFSIIMFILCLKDQRMISILGKWLTPILLITLAFLIIVGIINAPPLVPVSNYSPTSALYTGFTTGYQTMDLFAAFFFSALTFAQLKQIIPSTASNSEMIIFATKPSIIAVLLLSLIYLGFVFLGAYFKDLLLHTPPEYMLAKIADHIIGKQATILISITMIFSCITTAIALNNIYARYLCSILNLDASKFKWILLITTVISFAISLFNFNGIAKFLAILLEISYPSVIILTILSIFTRKFHYLKITLFYGVLIIMVLKHFGFLKFI